MSDYTVLIIEDHEKNRRLLRDLLRVHGYQSIEAVDGPSGLDATRLHLPDLVLMDIQLPGLDGYSVTRAIKADAKTRAIPVVAVTSFAMAGEEDNARAAGCDAYLSKPIDIHLLVDTVKGFLPLDESGDDRG